VDGKEMQVTGIRIQEMTCPRNHSEETHRDYSVYETDDEALL
jgi:hypothetical protein